MKRFFCLMTAAGLCLFAACADKAGDSASFEQMQEQFRAVPAQTPLAVYWYWISDNISREGVVKDLEAMKRVGINRAFIGNIGLDDIPYGEHKILSQEWWEIMHAALKTAGELDIEIGIFNSPGWSQSGGPWVKSEESMRYLASTETLLRGPVQFSGGLPSPGEDVQDVRVIAYPAPAAGESMTRSAFKRHGEPLRLEMRPEGNYPVRSLTIQPDRPVLTTGKLYGKTDGEYRLLKEIEIDRSNMQTNVGFWPMAPIVVSLPGTVAEEYMLELPEQGDMGLEVTLSSRPMVERYPEKTLAKMFQTPLPLWHDYMWEAQPAVSDPSLVVASESVIDITEHFDGERLVWDVPEGDWRVLRTGMLTTTVTNSPASPEGVGLEIDKMSREHVATHFDAFMGEILRRIPAEDRRTFKVVVQDSYETGGQNWTDDMAERFEEVYGYDPVPWLPVLSGVVVDSPDRSDRFLWDLRRLVADRVAYDYVGGLRDESHKHGLVTWLENYGHWGFPGEFLQYGGQSDEVAGEFWAEGSLGDIENRAASSCAHIYGKKHVWAESFTAAGVGFSRYPYLMKQRGDRFFTEGINSTLLHVFIHQPYEDRDPGMSAWFGNEFNRKNTWFDQSDVFIEYLKRANYMLQQGQYVADVAYFIGEDAPKMTGVCDPELPRGYSFDYINAEVLMNHAKVKDSRLVLDSGMEYRVLVLPRQNTMRPELLAKLRDMVSQGLVILGPAPEFSPSMAGYPDADVKVKTLAGELWNGVGADGYSRFSKGYVFGEGNTLDDVFSVLSLIPDMKTGSDEDPVLFIHRQVPGGDIYFVSNQAERKIDFEAAFRTSHGRPELWDAVTGEIRRLPEFTREGETTTVPMELEAYGSAFIVFRESGDADTAGVNFPEPNAIAEVEGDWDVTFSGLSAPSEPVAMESLYDWTASADPRIRYFSGTARYRNAFELASVPEGQLYIDLDKVMVMGKVYINGRYAGGVWTYPYRVNITDLVTEGDNVLEVEVANNWMNRLIGDQNLPEGQRHSWTSANSWTASSPLQSSGLLGPVTLVTLDYDPVK